MADPVERVLELIGDLFDDADFATSVAENALHYGLEECDRLRAENARLREDLRRTSEALDSTRR